MKNFKSFLTERPVTEYDVDRAGWNREVNVTVYVNPDTKELRNIMKESDDNSVRGIITVVGDVYVWRGDVLHEYIIKKFQQDYDDDNVGYDFKSIQKDYYNLKIDRCAPFIIHSGTNISEGGLVMDEETADVVEDRVEYAQVKRKLPRFLMWETMV